MSTDTTNIADEVMAVTQANAKLQANNNSIAEQLAAEQAKSAELEKSINAYNQEAALRTQAGVSNVRLSGASDYSHADKKAATLDIIQTLMAHNGSLKTDFLKDGAMQCFQDKMQMNSAPYGTTGYAGSQLPLLKMAEVLGVRYETSQIAPKAKKLAIVDSLRPHAVIAYEEAELAQFQVTESIKQNNIPSKPLQIKTRMVDAVMVNFAIEIEKQIARTTNIETIAPMVIEKILQQQAARHDYNYLYGQQHIEGILADENSIDISGAITPQNQMSGFSELIRQNPNKKFSYKIGAINIDNNIANHDFLTKAIGRARQLARTPQGGKIDLVIGYQLMEHLEHIKKGTGLNEILPLQRILEQCNIVVSNSIVETSGAPIGFIGDLSRYYGVSTLDATDPFSISSMFNMEHYAGEYTHKFSSYKWELGAVLDKSAGLLLTLAI